MQAAVNISVGLDCEAVSPLGSVEFHATNNSMNARIVSSLGFGCAAGFCVFQLWV